MLGRMAGDNCLLATTTELWALSLAPDVLASASPKLLYRTGLRPTGLGGIEGDWSPAPEAGLRAWREVMDRGGKYVRVRALSPESSEEQLVRDYTWRHTPSGLAMSKHQPEAISAVRARYMSQQDSKL